MRKENMAQTNRTAGQIKTARHIAIGRHYRMRRGAAILSGQIEDRQIVQEVSEAFDVAADIAAGRRNEEGVLVELLCPVQVRYVDRVDHTKPIVTSETFSTIADLVKGRGLDDDTGLAGSIHEFGPGTVYATIDPSAEDKGIRRLIVRSTMEDLEDAYVEAGNAD
jgi:L-arabinose isomerase